VSKLTTDVVTYCTEASNQKSKYAYRKILFYKKSTGYVSTKHTPLYSIPLHIYATMGRIGAGGVEAYLGMHWRGQLNNGNYKAAAHCAVQVNTSEYKIASVYCVQWRLFCVPHLFANFHTGYTNTAPCKTAF